MKTQNKNIFIIVLALGFLASVTSCRPRYLRCGKKRYCNVEHTKIKSAKTAIAEQHDTAPNNCK